MKVAILLTGFLRTYQYTLVNLKQNLLDKYNCDLYLVTWDKQENGEIITDNFFNIYTNIKKYKIVNSKEYYNNKLEFTPIDRDNDVFKINPRAIEHGLYWANRLIDQWKLVNESYNLIEKPEIYDIIIRLRFDLNIISINLHKNNHLNIPKDIGGWGFTDHMAYGNPTTMKIYCDLYHNIQNLYINHNIDITHAVDMPKYYIEINNVSFNIDNDINYSIFK